MTEDGTKEWSYCPPSYIERKLRQYQGIFETNRIRNGHLLTTSISLGDRDHDCRPCRSLVTHLGTRYFQTSCGMLVDTKSTRSRSYSRERRPLPRSTSTPIENMLATATKPKTFFVRCGRDAAHLLLQSILRHLRLTISDPINNNLTFVFHDATRCSRPDAVAEVLRRGITRQILHTNAKRIVLLACAIGHDSSRN